VIRPECCILNGSQDVFTLEIRIIVENLVEGGASARKLEDIGHADMHASIAGATAALSVVNGDSTQAFQ
jgi:hypothetical protein